ncbi:cell wall metabolism sensor histidine kinase WalK [Acaryochloris sp. 'Moss Beach']|uniref:sensor histidine kinase n=1 Tax=Acaryochloris sp. 'Moss Beach' TaxID=2740837 RepID=UPI001F464104|nr:HAMP domain-containing sensor histidine kinase [Acaryochloris sp. 'Moss Beach']
MLLLQDITQLKEVDRLKSEFVATASHELRTPLTGMTMSMGLLLETAEEKLSESELELLQTAQDDMQRLRALVNDLLDLSKIESGKISLDVASVDVSLLIDNALSMFKVQVQDQGVELKSVIADGLPPVRADANKITWVLTNLIANALRYTERGGQIEVKVSPRADVLHICVRDDGAGIPLEYQSKIFDKFVQVETEKDVGGSGLGLAICKEIVKANQGSIWVESMPGQGSTFTFTLPIADRSSSATGVKLNV